MATSLRRNRKAGMRVVAINIRLQTTAKGLRYGSYCNGCSARLDGEELHRAIRWANKHIMECHEPFIGWEFIPNVPYENLIIGCL